MEAADRGLLESRPASARADPATDGAGTPPARAATPRRAARPRARKSATHRQPARRRADAASPLTLSTFLKTVFSPGTDPDDLGQRDPDFIRGIIPYLDALTTPYFRPEFEGVENLPRSGPFSGAGNHNGGPMLADLWTLLAFWGKTAGPDLPVYCMVHDFAFRVRVAGNFFLKLGGIRARTANADRVLRAGGGVLLFPGGELDCYRSFWNRNEIDLHGRTGFVRLAFRHGAPIIPWVNIGGHETCIHLFSSQRLARWTGLTRLTRVKTLPVSLGLPWGLWANPFLPFLPLPAKFVYRFGEPIRVEHDPDRAEDEAAVRRVYRQVAEVMQEMLDDLAGRRRAPILG